MAKKISVGSLWKKEDKNGTSYQSGFLMIGKKKIYISVHQVTKERDNDADYKIMVRKIEQK